MSVLLNELQSILEAQAALDVDFKVTQTKLQKLFAAREALLRDAVKVETEADQENVKHRFAIASKDHEAAMRDLAGLTERAEALNVRTQWVKAVVSELARLTSKNN